MKFLRAISRVGGRDTDIEVPYSGSEDGGSQPFAGLLQGVASNGGAVAEVANNIEVNLPWNLEGEGGDLEAIFDLTDPTFPVCLADGLYFFSSEINMTAMGDDTKIGSGVFYVDRLLDFSGDFGDGPRGVVGLGGSGIRSFSLPMSRYITAGKTVNISINQNSGSAMENVWHWTHVLFLPFALS